MQTGGTIHLQDSTEAREITAPRITRLAAWKIYTPITVALLIVSQFYFFRELAAALLIFTILFLMCAAIAGAIYLIGRASQKGYSFAEPAARRGLVLAEVISRKTFHRPRSAPVQ